MAFPQKLSDKLKARQDNNAFRTLSESKKLIDFASNDYLGFSKSESIYNTVHQFLIDNHFTQNGATGSRLISGNHPLYTLTENHIAKFHQSQSALIFNSGYDANVGFFGSVPQKGDYILYDELIHASIRDGIRLSNARAYKFNHNDFEDLEQLIVRIRQDQQALVYIVTESVFSMDGDTPDLQSLADLCEKNRCLLVVDEAHALGVFGNHGEGLVQQFQPNDGVFARIVTFGKGLGCHGAAILGSSELRDYLVNFARSLIYTTGLSPHSTATILIAYQHLETETATLQQLRDNINHFNQQKQLLGLKPLFVRSKSAIQSAIIPGNEKVKAVANQLQQHGFDVKAILSPTVPEGQERLRICLHSYNTKEELTQVLDWILLLISDHGKQHV